MLWKMVGKYGLEIKREAGVQTTMTPMVKMRKDTIHVVMSTYTFYASSGLYTTC